MEGETDDCLRLCDSMQSRCCLQRQLAAIPSNAGRRLPPTQRPKIFYVGSWEFDPVRVGVETGSPFAGSFTFDVRLPGNANSGHEYGTDLSDPERMALIEFLKTL